MKELDRVFCAFVEVSFRRWVLFHGTLESFLWSYRFRRLRPSFDRVPPFMSLKFLNAAAPTSAGKCLQGRVVCRWSYMSCSIGLEVARALHPVGGSLR